MRTYKRIIYPALFVLLTPALAGAQKIRPAEVTPGWLGVGCNVTVVVRDGKSTVTVGVGQVVPGSPADRGGLRPGDRIVRIDGRPIEHDNCAALSRGLGAGDTVTLRVASANGERDVTMVAAERPIQYSAAVRMPEVFDVQVHGDSIRRMALRLMESARFPFPADGMVLLDSLHVRNFPGTRVFGNDTVFFRNFPGGRVFSRVWADSLGDRTFFVDSLPRGFRFEMRQGDVPFDFPRFEVISQRSVAGAEFTELNPGLSQYFGADEGLLVLRVGPGTPAARAGLDAGDVITRVDGRPVNIVEDVRAALARTGEQTVKLEILRKGKAYTLDLEKRVRRP